MLPTVSSTQLLFSSEARQLEKSWLTAIIESSDDAIISKTLEGIITSWNPSAERIFGYSAAEMVGTPMTRLFPTERVGEEERILARLKSGERVDHFLTVRKHKDGHLLYVQVTISPIRDGEGTIVGASKIAREMSGSAPVLEELHQSQERLKLATESAHIGVWDWDVVTNTLVWDDQMYVLYGIRPQDFSGAYEAWQQGLHPDDVERGDAEIKAALDGTKDFHTQFRVVWPSGEVRCIEAHASVQRALDGTPLRMIGVNWDITTNKHNEANIQLLNAELEQRVASRTEQLERANKELEAFSYSVSHDLRAPVRAILGYARILREDHGEEFSDEASHFLTRIAINGEKMGALIDDLLAFSRLGRQNLNTQLVAPDRIVQQVWDDLAPEREGRAVEFTLGGLPVCHTDPVLLRQVIYNLLANALKFSRERQPALIEVGFQDGDDEQIYFVRDNGAGFDMQYADKLFGVFQRLHRETEFEGTGVGLAIVQRIVQRHEGRVWAEAEVGQGATFYFSIKKQGSENS